MSQIFLVKIFRPHCITFNVPTDLFVSVLQTQKTVSEIMKTHTATDKTFLYVLYLKETLCRQNFKVIYTVPYRK